LGKDLNFDEINDFYSWIRDYWSQLSESTDGVKSNILNFGYWADDQQNLFDAQNHFFDTVATMIGTQGNDATGVEIGCGIGGFAIRLLKKYPINLTCYDLLGEHLDKTRAYAQQEQVADRLKTVKGSSMDMSSFHIDELDFAYCIESSFHYDEKQRFFNEVYRALKPGAVFVFADISCEDNSKINFKSGNHFSSKSELDSYIENSNFTVQEHIDIGTSVYQQLHQFIKQYNKNILSKKQNASKVELKVARYWELVLNNYTVLNQKELMGYQIYKLKK